MKNIPVHFVLILVIFCCKDKKEKTKPSMQNITSSVYASGILKSKNQYEAYPSGSGIIQEIFVKEGDSLIKGSPILSIVNQTQQLNRENAKLNADFADVAANQGKLRQASQQMNMAKSVMKNDLLQLERQKTLWSQQIGTKLQLEQKELAYKSSKTNYNSAIIQLSDLKKQLNLNAAQSKNNLKISTQTQNDYILKSQIKGVVYSLNKVKGEMVGPQTPLAIIGSRNSFLLEMQVDEYDILKIKTGMKVWVTMQSYKGKVFEAKVSRINPIMNLQTKSFLIEAEFIDPPKTLYPNISFEANIELQTKTNVLLVDRNYLLNDSILTKSNGDKVVVKTGLKDYQKVEIISGISADDELIKPTP